MGSRLILSQVIGNLFANAAEAIAARGTGSGTISVTIEEAGGQTRIAIRDDGEGFAAERAAALFQRGLPRPASMPGNRGPGRGCTWCANSMGAMQGSLRLESEGPGMGAAAPVR